MRMSDRTQGVARVIVDSQHSGTPQVLVTPWGSEESLRRGKRSEQQRIKMAEISRFLATADGPLSQNAIVEAVKGKATVVRTALDALVEGGFVARTEGNRGSYLHTLVKPYQRSNDPQSEAYAPLEGLHDPEQVA